MNTDSFEAIPGHGIRASVNGKDLLLGNKKLMVDRKISLGSLEEDSDILAQEGKTLCI